VSVQDEGSASSPALDDAHDIWATSVTWLFEEIGGVLRKPGGIRFPHIHGVTDPSHHLGNYALAVTLMRVDTRHSHELLQDSDQFILVPFDPAEHVPLFVIH
jgi:hypothetical protein